MRCERGQATVEWVGLVLLCSLTFGGIGSLGPEVDGRSFGGFLAHRFVCAVKGGCRDGDAALARAYGRRDAELVRRHAPNLVYEPGERQLPVDYRRCRAVRCAEAPDDRDLDAHLTATGLRATVYTRLIHRGGRTYIQYWLYYPDSNSAFAGSDKLWDATLLRLWKRYPGYHPDDWEAYQVRVERNGDVYVRASAHGHYQGCKQRLCKGRWIPRTGWTRVSRGSHAGHIPVDVTLPRRRLGPVPARRARFEPRYPGRHMRERTTTGEGLRLIPLEGTPRRSYRPLPGGIEGPWTKPAYRDPESPAS